LPRPRKPQQAVSLVEMVRVLATGVSTQASRPNIYAYEPHPKQTIFHSSERKVRLYLGGNRSGKTTSGIIEDIYWLRGSHPHFKVPEPPVAGRIVTVDILEGINQIIIPNLKRWLPPSLLINGSWEDSYNKSERLLTLSNGSTCELMTYEQDVGKFAGTARHFMHFDEEPPKPIYDECRARLIDYNGRSWLTMTPLDGMTWVYEELFEPAEDGNHPTILVVEADMLDNPHISEAAAKEYLDSLDPDERLAREHGKFVQLGGKVYKSFARNIHVVPSFVPPREWEWHASLDHGFNNPTAVLWHAVNPDNGHIVTFAEHYKREMTVDQHAIEIKKMETAFKKIPEYRVADPAIAQRNAISGTSIQTEYALRQLYWGLGNNEVVTGVDQVNYYLRMDPRTNTPFWTITENCTSLIKEMLKLRWKTYASKKMQYDNNPREEIHKKDDHACDSARYFFSTQPDISGIFRAVEERLKIAPRDTPLIKYDQALVEMTRRGTDTVWNTFAGTDLAALEYD